MNKEFNVTMSTFFKVTTIACILLLIGVGFVLFNESETYVAIIYAIIIYPLFIYYYLISLNKIKVDLNNIYLISKIKTTIIPINEINLISKKSQNYLMVIGCRGFMGLIGRSVDDYRCNIKNKSKMIAIELEHKKYLISCNEPQDFINTINQIKNAEKTT
jgi:hypothetical protein